MKRYALVAFLAFPLGCSTSAPATTDGDASDAATDATAQDGAQTDCPTQAPHTGIDCPSPQGCSYGSTCSCTCAGTNVGVPGAYAWACDSTCAAGVDSGSGLAGTACSYLCGGIACDTTCDGNKLLACSAQGLWTMQQDCTLGGKTCALVTMDGSPDGNHECL